jgi:hypothetical protein
LNYLEVFCNFYKRKTEKEKSKRKRKGEKGPGNRSSPWPKTTHGPTNPPARIGTLLPLAHTDSGSHASVFFFPRPKSTPVIAEPTVTPLFNSD